MIFESGGKSGVFWGKSGVSFWKLSGNTGLIVTLSLDIPASVAKSGVITQIWCFWTAICGVNFHPV